MDERAAYLQLVQRFSRREVRSRLQARGSAQAALEGSVPARSSHPWSEARFGEQGITVLLPGDTAFPPLLRHIPDPPLALFLRGDLSGCTERTTVAVVGARRSSDSGRAMARAISSGVAAQGCVVISGLAAGVDGAAHSGALDEAREGSTVAVLGHGLGNIYPARHRPLARRILAQGGALISEYPPDTPPARWRFPERNRLISGLAVGVVLIEASARSGSLITARLALEQGRDVFVVPGPAGSAGYAGSHRLLRQGAALVESSGDVLEELGVERETRTAPAPPEELGGILRGLDTTPRLPDELAVTLGVAASEVSAALVRLELGGFVRQVSGGYIRVPFD